MERGACRGLRRVAGGLRFWLALLSVGMSGPLALAASGFTVGGKITGLGAGKKITLLETAGATKRKLTISGTSSGDASFTFSNLLAKGARFAVTVDSQPVDDFCSVADGTGAIASSDVVTVRVSCVPTYPIGGDVDNLPKGKTVTLLDTSAGLASISDVLPVTGSSATKTGFTYTKQIPKGDTFAVTVKTQPADESCAVTGGTGRATSAYRGVTVVCQPTFAISGTITGLPTGAKIELLLNRTLGSLTINGTASGTASFDFSERLVSGAAYAVTVGTQPTGHACTVSSNGSGTSITANVTGVTIACAKSNVAKWGWMAGSDTNNASGGYGIQGTGDKANSPGARNFSASWTDSSGDFWLFGGTGRDSTGNPGLLNDLWKWSEGEWTWVSGSDLAGQQGSYGTAGKVSSSNHPGARASAVGWTDPSGDFWLFGGDDGYSQLLNDLWKYSGGEWTWISGSDGFNKVGTYGTEGTAAAVNVPGARTESATWTDASGDLWLFGGDGYDSVGTDSGDAELNDLWKFTVRSGQWTWVGGSNTAAKPGNYGTKEIAASTNMPGARSGACHWTDKAGDFWLFGGTGYDSTGTSGFLNDLWVYRPSAGNWTWMSGSNLADRASVYGTKGTAASTNIPGARSQAACWMDADGNFWIFGGNGTVTPSNASINLFDDLWEYSDGQWVWVGGSNVAGQPGTYGTLGMPAATNLPEARYPAAWWTDASGNFWLFGGFGEYQTHVASNLNDMWEYLH